MANYCTMADEKYLDRLLALHLSLEQHCQPYRLWVLAMDGGAERRLAHLGLPNVTVVPLEFVETDELRATRPPARAWHEYVFTHKAAWISYVLMQNCTTHQEELGLFFDDDGEVAYIDADCFFFGSDAPLFEEIGEHTSLALTPHRFPPEDAWRNEANGVFNGGFVYARSTVYAANALQRWHEQLVKWCFGRSEGGKCYDQGYLTEWPEMWDNTKVLQGRGLNLAPWNQGQYEYDFTAVGKITVDGDPLVFYHFHECLRPLDAPGVIDPFVGRHIYGDYAFALGRADGMLK